MEEFDIGLLEEYYGTLAAAAELGGLTVPATYDAALLLTVGEAATLLDQVETTIEALDPSVFQRVLDTPALLGDVPAEALPFLEQLAAGDTKGITGLLGQASAALLGYGSDSVLADVVADLGGGTVEVPADISQAISDAQETLASLLWQSVGAAGAAFESPVFSVDEETGAWSVANGARVAYDGADLEALYATVGKAVSGAILDFLASDDAVLGDVVGAGATGAEFAAAAAAGQAAAQAAAARIQSIAELLVGAYDPAQVAFDAEAAATALREAFADALPGIGDALSGLIFGTRNSDPTFVVEFDGEATGSERDDRFYLTEGADGFDGGEGDDLIFGLGGNDTLEGGAGDDALFGGAGVDRAVFDGAAGDHLIQIVAGETVQVVVSGKAEGPGTDTLTEIEELEFGDGFSFHPDGAPLVDLTLWTGLFDGPVEIAPADMARFAQMYIAYFDRAPDVSGLLYWCERLSEGMTMAEIATSFFDQDESRALYPDPDDDAALVTAVYNNYLERDPDAEGEAYWLDQLARDDYNRGQFMLDIISGTTGPDGSAADAALVEDKGKIGIYYSAIAGLNDPVGLALDAMDVYDRTDPAASLAAAQGLIDDARSAAEAPDSGTEIIELVGFIDDPFVVA